MINVYVITYGYSGTVFRYGKIKSVEKVKTVFK